MLQNATSDQDLHCLQEISPFFSRNFKIAYHDIPDIEIRLFQNILRGSSFSLKSVKGERNLIRYCALKLRTLQTMNFDTHLINIGGKLSKF